MKIGSLVLEIWSSKCPLWRVNPWSFSGSWGCVYGSKNGFFRACTLVWCPLSILRVKIKKIFFLVFALNFWFFQKKFWKFSAWVDLLYHCPCTLQVSKRSVGKQASYDFLMNFCYFLVKIQNGARPKINPPLDAEFDGASNPGLSFSLTYLKTE